MIKKVILEILRIYQVLLSPLLGRRCRFYPSCSQYSYKAVEKYGVVKGALKSFHRVLKCHPLHKGGVDLP